MRLSFFGAAREVTGSNTLLEVSNLKILLECGLFQGVRLSEERNFEDFPYKAHEIDFVVVCHAHLDHTGRLPKLIRDGFCGKVLCTAPTGELARLVLEDSEKLMREEMERENTPPLYTKEHIEKLLGLIQTAEYEERIQLGNGVFLTFKNAGHILGSSIALIESAAGSIAYSSDLGNTPSILLDPPDYFKRADYLICESTYGGRTHENVSMRREKLADILSSVIINNGVLMIPTFAIERTQELLHDIDHFCTSKKCERPNFFLDSPLAERVTEVYKNFPSYLGRNLKNDHPDNDFFGLGRFMKTSSVKESKAIEDAVNPKIIIAGSGMMNGGRILFHLRNYLPSENNVLLIVGYQARGTLGRRLLEGASEVKIFGEKVPVRAQIKAIGSYSAHADMPQLVSWISKTKGIKKVFLVHGETDQALALSKKIEVGLKISCVIPQRGETYNLGTGESEEEKIWPKSFPAY